MKRIHHIYVIAILIISFISSCRVSNRSFSIDDNLDYCRNKALISIEKISYPNQLPGSLGEDSLNWLYTVPGSWVSGFWPGILWYLYEDTGDEFWLDKAVSATSVILPTTYKRARSHDLGFITMTSLGNGYRLSGKIEYKEALLRAADSLAVLYNPIVGTILSWPGMKEKNNWPHNTIIDNMMNLELLFWASKNGGDNKLYHIACSHADKTMENHYHDDYICYHVALYDTITGKFIKGVTHQGFSDSSMWARGQAWAIYGFTMSYRETKNLKYLDFAEKVADTYLRYLPNDYIPYWDFRAGEIFNSEPKDASAAAISASGLLELSTYITDTKKANKYFNSACKMLERLSTSEYKTRDLCPAFLCHSVGHKPNDNEVDVSLIYADYYYMEALLRLKKINKLGTLYQ